MIYCFLNCDKLCILQGIHINPLTVYRNLILLTVECNMTSERKEINVCEHGNYACSIPHRFLYVTFNYPNRAADPVLFNGIIDDCALA
jgi:hypothetical protein